MPQLNIETFVTQYTWMIIVLSILYYKVANSPELGEIIKMRRRAN